MSTIHEQMRERADLAFTYAEDGAPGRAWAIFQEIADEYRRRFEAIKAMLDEAPCEDAADTAEDDEDDTPSEQPRRFHARVYRREDITSREDVTVMAHSRAEARKLIEDGEVENATNWECTDTDGSELLSIERLEPA